MDQLDQQIRECIKHFWATRDTQSQNQGALSGIRDTGTRAAVTGGKQMDGFIQLVRNLLVQQAGLLDVTVYCNRNVELPGYFRPEKKWDIVAVSNGDLIASIEFKSQVGSFGNNYNNRTEEAIGNATDVWAAYREGAFQESIRPWLGYMMLLEESPRSMCRIRCREPHFKVFEEFRDASYAKRYEVLCHKLLRERLYDGTCFMMSDAVRGKNGYYIEPSKELSFQNFTASLLAKAIAYVKSRVQ